MKTDLKSIYEPVAGELSQVEQYLLERVVHADSPAAAILRAADRSGGKLLRPALVLLSGKLDGPLGEAHATAAAAIELIHRASLLHDDVLDEAAIRRDRPTANAIWGNALAVLAGDVLLSHAFTLVTQLPDPAVFEVFAEAARRTCEGEIRQLLRQRDLSISEEDCLQIAREKTASLWAAACHVGARLARRSAREMDALRQYGLELGTAYQIADDCIDVAGRQAAAGKTLGTDLRSGRFTLPVVHLISIAPQAARELLEPDAFRGGDGDAAVEQVRRSLLERGSLRYAADRAARLARSAAAKLDDVPRGPSRDSLLALADYVIDHLHEALLEST